MLLLRPIYLRRCFNTPLDVHTPKPLRTGYNGIPFIYIYNMARGIAWGVLQGCVVIFLEFPHLDVEIAIVRKLPIPATKKSWYCLEAGDNAMQDLPNLERIVMDGFQETRH